MARLRSAVWIGAHGCTPSDFTHALLMTPPAQDSETILIVEDDDALRSRLAMAFERRKDPPSERSVPASSSVPSLARAEREHIDRILADCGGNISQARILKLPSRSLQRKMRKVLPGDGG